VKIGYLGIGKAAKDVAFVVSSKTIETFNNLKVTKQARYSTHKIHGHRDVPEMTGISGDTITFELLLSAYLGVNPKRELEKLENFMTAGTICNLVMGDQLFGSWVIKSIPYNVEYIYKEGDITQAKVTISLLEVPAETMTEKLTISQSPNKSKKTKTTVAKTKDSTKKNTKTTKSNSKAKTSYSAKTETPKTDKEKQIDKDIKAQQARAGKLDAQTQARIDAAAAAAKQNAARR